MNKRLYCMRSVYICWACEFVTTVTEGEKQRHEDSQKHKRNAKRREPRGVRKP